MGSKDLRLRHAIHRLLHQHMQEQYRMAGATTTFETRGSTTTSDATTEATVMEATRTAATTVASNVTAEDENVVSTTTDNATAAAAAAAEAAEAAAAMEFEMMRPHYIVVVSMLLVVCLITLVLNVVILSSAFWIRRPMTPTLSLSVSLAGADAYNALFLGNGLLINSLLPQFYINVHDTDMGTCIMFAFEAMRVGGVFVSVAHLLALAINHYLGILRPLHYAATLTPRITSVLIVALWFFPIAFFFVYFSSIQDQGFRSKACIHNFMLEVKYRLVFTLLFFVPLAAMVFIYFHIYCIVRRTQCSRQRSRLGRQCDNGGRVLVRPTSGENSVDSNVSRVTTRSRQLARNWKAVVTTMLILGTYIIGWIPAVLIFLLICKDCALQRQNLNTKVLFYFYCFTNLLIILKSFSNPIIYAARMQEIKAALGRMKEAMFGRRTLHGTTSGLESTHGYERPRGCVNHSGFCCSCCRSTVDSDRTMYGSDISRNRMSTYASTTSAGNATAMTNSVVLFRIRSLHNSSVNGGANCVSDPTPLSSMGHLHRSSTRSQQRRREDLRNRITGI